MARGGAARGDIVTVPGDGERRRPPGSARHAAIDAESAPEPGSLDRVVVVGTTGSGKTALARELARALDVPHVEFDAHRHGPGWSETPDDVFRERLRDALAGGSWVGDGNYRLARGVVWPRATLLLWLDYPLRVVLWRLCRRIVRRAVRRPELWNGNRESIRRQLLTRDSLILWALKSHGRHRREIPRELERPEHRHLRLVRLRTPREAAAWLDGLPGRRSGAVGGETG